ncbi:hypothetical protein [Kutzneria kofuensis]|uniref:hypothetical protein n=1 Tax=Kutzneria kofuensis TaxID=103725 RepID=UPI0031EFFFCD
MAARSGPVGTHGIQTQSAAFFTRHTALEHLRRVAALHRVSLSGADEAESLCDRVAIIQSGRIVAVDTPAGLRERTGATSLEDAYLALVAS